MAISEVMTQSRMPSGTGSPWRSSTQVSIIRWPTLRTSSRLRPCRVSRVAVGRGVDAIGVEAAGHVRAALAEGLRQRAVHQAEPVAIGRDLVVGIDGGDGVFQVDDGGDGGFEHHIGHAGDVVLADVVPVVDLDLDVQAVVAQQDGARLRRIAAIADELRGIGQADQLGADRPISARLVEPGVGDALEADDQPAVLHGVAPHLGMRALGERRDLVEEALGPGEHLGAAHGIVAAAARGAVVLGQHVGAVERVVEAAPAGVGGVERVAGVGDRHHQLRAGDVGDLGIDVGGVDGEVGALRAPGSRSRPGTPCRRQGRTACPCAPGARRRSWPAARRAS